MKCASVHQKSMLLLAFLSIGGWTDVTLAGPAPKGPPSSTISAPSMSSSSSGGKGRRSFILTPLSANIGEGAIKGEFNLGGNGGLTIELAGMGKRDIYTKKESEEHNGDTLILERGAEYSLHYARYANSAAMSGAYWSLGAGYRAMETHWNRTPDGSLTLNSGVTRDEDGRVFHSIDGRGTTGHARAGYRYVAESWPFAAGAFAGVRHFNNEFKDNKDDLEKGAAATPDADLQAMKRRFTTGLELGLELGIAF